MRFERRSVAEEGLVSLRNCFLEGSAEEEKSARKVRRRAILTSIIVQILVLAALVLYPMLSHGERLPLTVVTPTVPYSYSGGHPSQPNGPRHPTPRQQTYGISAPTYIPPTIVTTDPARPTPGGDEQIGIGIPGVPDGDRIIGAPNALVPEKGPVKPQPEVKTHENKRISIGHIEPAMLTHRVEPVYPALPRQLHREGRVELRAVIATDGTIQSLEVVSGDPMFYDSALAAVREWHYKATVLDGQAVEVETQISVIYKLNQ
jgi:periplasmic protein TonB